MGVLQVIDDLNSRPMSARIMYGSRPIHALAAFALTLKTYKDTE